MKRIVSLLMCCLTLCFCAILCTRCTNERINPNPEPPSVLKNGQVSLKILVPRGSISTYANTDASADENHIDTLYVDLYQDGTLIKESKFSSSELTIGTNTNDSIVMIDYEVDNITTGKLFAKVYANRKTVKIISDEIPNPAGTAATSLFMSGQDSVRSNGTSYEGTIHLVRDVAKIRVNISKHSLILPSDLEIDYANVKIQALTVPNQTSLFQLMDAAKSQSGFVYINYTERGPSPLSPLRRSPTSFNPTAGGQIDSFYVNENHLSAYDVPSDETTSTNITKVKVTIPTYSPTEGAKVAYYTYALYTTAGGYTLLRNYIYTLDIKVRGQSLEPVITVNMQPWGDITMDGSIYGTYLTTPSEIKFDSNGEAVIDFCTDAQALYFNFKDFETNTGIEIGFDGIETEGVEYGVDELMPDGFKDGHILLDRQHCGSFKFRLDLGEALFSKFPEFNVSGKICVKAGNIVKCLMLPAQRIYDAHFIVGDSIFRWVGENYTYASVHEDAENNIRPEWLNISTARSYNQTEMRTSYEGSATTLYLHLDENLTGYSRTGSVAVTTSSGVEKKLNITQLPAIPVGRFGYANMSSADDSIYTAMLYTEQRYEFTTMLPYISSENSQIMPGNAIYNGRMTAITTPSVFDWSNYNNNFNYRSTVYQAINYCAYKNRITSTSVKDDLKWYLPAQAQLMGLWLSYNSYKDIATSNFIYANNPADIFWSSTSNNHYTREAQLINFKFGNVGHHYRTDKYWVRCVRDGATTNSMILTSKSYPVIDFGIGGMPAASLTTTSKVNVGGTENSTTNQTLYKTLRVAIGDIPSSGAWNLSACASYTEGSIGGWRLPTQRELQAIWILQYEIKKNFTGFDLFKGDYYWSATEASEGGGTHAWTIYGSGSRTEPGSSGNAPIQHKSQQLRIRCVKEEL